MESTDPEEETRLLNGLRSGNPSAFTAIYKKYWYPMFRIVYGKTGRREVSEEIVQDIFTRLWREREVLTIIHLNRYLFTAVRYETINHMRSRVLYDEFDDCFQDLLHPEDSDTENTILLNDLLDTIDRGLEGLPEKSREIFRLNRLNHWSVSKIAEHFRLSEKAVEYHITKALKHMRTYLNDTLIFLLLLFTR